MYIIGITGPTGAGKTAAMRALEKQGAAALDCDEIYHGLLAKNADMIRELKARFPSVATDDTIDRKKLAGIVFADKQALTDLNSITHKFVHSEVQRSLSEFKKSGRELAVICAIALIESGISRLCDSVMAIIAPRDLRIERLKQRDNLSSKEIIARIDAQQQDEFYITSSDYTLNNIYDNPAQFEEAVMNTAAIDKWFAGKEHAMIADLGRLVEVNSVQGESRPGAPFGKHPRKALSNAQELLEKHGFEVTVFNDMVISATLGPKPEKLGILTHLDIVPAGEGWDTDPFVLTEKDGRLYGRGAMDNKGPAIAAMYAACCVRELCGELRHGVRLIFGSSEETGFDDIAQYLRHCSANPENAMPPNVFSPDAEFPVINIEKGRYMPAFCATWEKDTRLPRVISISGGSTPNILPGYAEAVIEGIKTGDAEAYCTKFKEKTGVSFTVSANTGSEENAAITGNDILTVTAGGIAAHASRPKLGNNAQSALVEMLADMPLASSKSTQYIRALARLFPHGDDYGNALGLAMEDELSGKTTVCFSVLSLNEHGFTGNFDARTAICADEADICDITQRAFERESITVTQNDIKRSHHTPQDTAFVQALLNVYEKYTGQKGSCKSMGGLTYVHDIEGGVAYGCNMPGEDNNIHGPNEFISVDRLILSAKMFARVIMEICKK